MKTRSKENIKIEALVDIRDINVNQDMDTADKILDFIKQIKNPYIYKHGDTVVRVSFEDTETTFEDRMKGYFEML